MVETLLSPSNVLLYGRVMQDLKIVFTRPSHEPIVDTTPVPGDCDPSVVQEPPGPPPRLGSNRLLEDQLGGDDLGAEPGFARIYGFSYEGHYYDLAAPTIFLVHGDGSDPEAFRPARGLPNARTSRAPADADRTGVAGQAGSFSEDIKVWSYDKGDFSIRLDIATGVFEDILLVAEMMADGPGASYSGANVRGANVRGANVRGANVRGANVRGANVRGANVRGGGGSGD